MGQGFSLTTLSAGSANIDVPELADLQYEKSLGAARFMKAVRARHKDGLVVARVVMKPYAQFNFHVYVRRLLNERRLLAEVPNALAYHRIIETAACGYLVRQYIHSSLYDRLSTRPFLEEIEKKWLSFQLLCAVRDCHARNIFHGDIKTENVLVTSWNWLYLADFSASYKPAHLPEDNPADFSFYFDLSGRRTCYLAPERFLASGQQPEGEGEVNWAMDIFSVGCVIAELFLEAPIFSLSQLFKYRQGEYHPEHSHLSKIQDTNIRELVVHMIQVDPSSRMSADDYLMHWKEKVFPSYFYGFLQQYMYSITDPSSGRKPVTTGAEHLGEPDERIEQIYNDYDKIAHLLSDGGDKSLARAHSLPPKPNAKVFPLYVNIPNYQHQVTPAPSLAIDDGNLVFLTIIVSCLRGTARASARVRGLELLMAFSERLTDEAKLDRVIPYVTQLLTDKSEQVKIAALRTLTQILSMVQVVSPLNAYIFPEYVLPRLEAYLPDSTATVSALVRMQYAFCIGTLSTTAARYLDMIQALRAEGSLPATDPETEDDLSSSTHRNQFDSDRRILLETLEKHTKALLTDSDASVRRAMLRSVSDLCVFFGSPRANDVVLSHLNTYLNDPDWMLKCAFFEAIVGVAVFVGGASLEGYILPLMVQALSDPEEFVVEKVMRALASMAELGLFQRSKTWELVDIVARLSMHPNLWIREAAAQFISTASKYLSIADTHSILVNLIRPYLKVVPSDFSHFRVLESLKPPLSRLLMEMSSNWALQSQKGLFWVPARQQQTFTFGSNEDSLPSISGRELDHKVLQRLPKNEEDELWLKKLRNAGLTSEDDFKLVALREFIWRVSHRRRSDGQASPPTRFNNIVALKDLGVQALTVLFDEGVQQTVRRSHKQEPRHHTQLESQPRTIQDALLDASTTEADVLADRMPHPEGQAERLLREERGPGRISVPSRPKFSSPPSDSLGIESPSPEFETQRSSLQIPRDSPTNQSPVGSFGNSEHAHTLRQRHSTLGLLGKGENKALPETGTVSANVFGKVDGAVVRESSRSRQPTSPLAVDQHAQGSSQIKFRNVHNYTGNDPAILKLLDSMLLERFPSGETEFGPRVQVAARKQPIRYKDAHQSAAGVPWRPEGQLVASFGEHTAAVTRILVSPDQGFFISGSDDGCVKIWDASRLERNISRRSRQTYKLGDDVKVTSLVFVEQTYSFVATGSDGSVHVVRVDYHQSQDGTAKFGRPRLLREYQLPRGDQAVWSEHYNEDSKSVLLLATNTSKVIALELRVMQELFTLKNPLNHGTPTCFCVDRRAHWLLLGTSHGVLDLWDLRFRLRLKAWVCHGAAPIHRLTQVVFLQPKRTRLYIAGGSGQGELTVWDFEKLICKEVYRTGTSKDMGSKSTTLVDLDEEKPGGMLGRFATALEPSASSAMDRGIRALAVHTQTVDDKSESKHTFFLTAGPDWKIRYWDSNRPEASMIVSGLEADEVKPQYMTSQSPPDTMVVTERLSQPQGQTLNGRDSRSSPSRKSTQKSPRSGVISSQQQHLLKSHLDSILDVALIEQPYGMVISGDRSGVINMFM
ncbi:non-specific serine/threonine protein kinase [Parastagonospora nodorum]|uniref:non-specific serine/threonine protein kinase n=1 Tax=Phaeosphaeria nodorum (strain SN15 / ATCC MYA-4574 / FGSC 10173) TaxID=321614 RepID=A0A7U2F1K9_PHANO|nr:non-specific serine/threonine protein kinase [Parastagonospora nodorum]QRC97015.1 non-specific serine/threonine protein kinase [Parastagonospora nodorum SN15]KAH3921326.1 non-specific serine/threonine protein kinase [Parastagonospora nodorum]KAH3944539.1 non-specific serine/threonine protein kinase [Parastagonospora nodorum]KAH3959417.1 non-specific serine/threonine protein kinase [Parastagonospora nodorum]